MNSPTILLCDEVARDKRIKVVIDEVVRTALALNQLKFRLFKFFFKMYFYNCKIYPKLLLDTLCTVCIKIFCLCTEA